MYLLQNLFLYIIRNAMVDPTLIIDSRPPAHGLIYPAKPMAIFLTKEYHIQIPKIKTVESSL